MAGFDPPFCVFDKVVIPAEPAPAKAGGGDLRLPEPQ